MATSSSGAQPEKFVRSTGPPRHFIRPAQRILSSQKGAFSPAKVAAATLKRAASKQEDHPPVLAKQRYDGPGAAVARRVPMPSQKMREAASNPYNDDPATSSHYGSEERSFEYDIDEDEAYEIFYDQLPPRMQEQQSPHKKQGHAPPRAAKSSGVSIVNMGKAAVTGKRDILSQPVDVQQLIEKYVNADTPKESEAWLINIGLCEKLNLVNREMDKMRAEIAEMRTFVIESAGKAKQGPRERLTLTSPWPGSSPNGVTPVPFGYNPAPQPAAERDFVVPPIYCKNEVDCRLVYTDLQRKGKKRPGVVFLATFIRQLFGMTIEPPHKYLLTMRFIKRHDELQNLAPEYMKPIEDFFMATCEVTSGMTYAMSRLLREALAHECRELRRAPRKEKIKYIDVKMLQVLKSFEDHGAESGEIEEGEGERAEGMEHAEGREGTEERVEEEELDEEEEEEEEEDLHV